MVKNISFLIISVAILITGIVGFNKLNYGDRSVLIFSFSSDSPMEGRTAGNHGGFEGRGESGGRDRFERPGRRELSDSLRARFETAQSEGGMRNGEGRGRGGFTGGKKINLRNVLWFLAVFASFTVLVIYIDKGYYLIRKGRLR